MDRLCLFIVPYFGTFPNYFPLFLESCRRNPSYSWLILTDNREPYDYPENVRVVHMEFDQLRQSFQEKLDIPIALERPYKLCDFRPAYGFLLEEYLEGFRYWGHCDSDLVFGNLERMLTPLLDQDYDKLFALGHLVLYRNTRENNRRFMEPYRGELFYKKVFANPDNCWYDEDYRNDGNIHRIFLEDGARVWDKDLSFGVSVEQTRFRRVSYAGPDTGCIWHPVRRALYVWNQGELEETFLEKGKLKTSTYLYMHFQLRNMRFRRGMEKEAVIRIYPNGFRPLDSYPADRKQWRRLSRYSPNFQYFSIRWRRVKRRLENWLRKPKQA